MAGVDKLIHFQRRGVEDLHHPKKYGFIITNPPYGERLQDKSQMPQLYRTMENDSGNWIPGVCI